MAEELKLVDISHVPDLLRLVEEVRADGQPRVLQVNHEDAAILAPVRRVDRRPRRDRRTSADDPLWKIVGIARSDGPGDVSEHVDAYLAEVYAPREE